MSPATFNQLLLEIEFYLSEGLFAYKKATPENSGTIFDCHDSIDFGQFPFLRGSSVPERTFLKPVKRRK